MPRNLHRHPLRNHRPDQVSHCRLPVVMKDLSLKSYSLASFVSNSPKILDGLAITVENERTSLNPDHIKKAHFFQQLLIQIQRSSVAVSGLTGVQGDDAFFQIHPVPGQSQDLTLPPACR